MPRRATPVSFVLFACAVALIGCGPQAGDSRASGTAAAPQVGVMRVEAQTHTFTTELPGRTSARQIAEIRPQVGGIVKRRLFEEGAKVEAGQVLYEIDPASFEAAHASAKASLARAEATLNTARTKAERNTALVKIGAISQQIDDDSQAALLQARAELGVARAALQTTRIALDRTRITAPIAGRVEMSAVSPGALVIAEQAAALTTVQQLDPLYVDVVQSSAELLRLKRLLAEGSLQRGGAAEAPVRLVLEDGSRYPHAGRLQFSGVTVDRGTGAVTLRALVPNPDGLLLPGMYVRAVVETGTVRDALLVPQQGITRAPSGDASAFVIGANDKVEQRPVTVDRAVGNRWQVTSGLKVGDLLIVDGMQRIKVGAKVRPVPVDIPGTTLASPVRPASAASKVRS